MKLMEGIEKSRKRVEIKKKVKKGIRKILYVIIGIPVIAIEKKIKEFEEKQWQKNPAKSKQKVLNEMVAYIKRDLSIERNNMYFVYNAYRHDDIDYGNAFYMHEFLAGYGGKYNKQTQKFYQYVITNQKGSRNDYYDYFLNEIKSYFQAFEDLEVTHEFEKKWTSEYECLKIKVNRGQ